MNHNIKKNNYKVALCNDIDVFDNNSLQNHNIGEKYYAMHGHLLFNYCKDNNIEIVSGDIALKNVSSGVWKIKDVLVVQELESAKHGKKLVQMGAIPLVLTGYESAFIAFNFYRKINNIADKFINVLTTKGNFKYLNQNNIKKAKEIYQPGIRSSQINKSYNLVKEEWENKKPLVIISANKHYDSSLIKIKDLINYKSMKMHVKEYILKKISTVYKENYKLQLQDKRFDLINFFAEKNYIDVYGKGWDNPLPKKWVFLSEKYKKIFKGYAESEEKTFNHYKFALCIENFSQDSYITEKIFRCFIHNVIPIYLGAPNIDEIIPSNTYIDYRHFSSNEDLYEYLEDLSFESARDIRNNINKWLMSDKKKYHTYEYSAKYIFDIIVKFINNNDI